MYRVHNPRVLYTCACTFISFYMHIYRHEERLKKTSDLENERKQERKNERLCLTEFIDSE